MLLVAPLAYVALAGAAFGPGSAPLGTAGLPGQQTQPVEVAKASLSYSGVDPIITGLGQSPVRKRPASLAPTAP